MPAGNFHTRMLVVTLLSQDHGCIMSVKVPYCNFEGSICNDSPAKVLTLVSVLCLKDELDQIDNV